MISPTNPTQRRQMVYADILPRLDLRPFSCEGIEAFLATKTIVRVS